MIAVAVKTDKEKGVLSPLFGKAKFFSIIDDAGNITTHANAEEGGMKVARWLQSLGVTSLIANHLGEKPFHALQGAGIKIYFAGAGRVELEDVLQKLKEGALEEVTVVNYMDLLGEEEHDHGEEEGASHHGKKHHCCSKHAHKHQHGNENALSKRGLAHQCNHFHAHA
ncbi:MULTISPECIES: NifB/NifX family molybdenum-iron cluster-binding protein [unclassified Sulfurospirillum]|uniref:NifB/NifX family molybdenum-iron cluster-binding protein n=1 Tax=unclassified Sulfurospirillum TaxID=2618290 RepID=UPI00068FC565|nr:MULTISPECIES: NifB/NifX family molybdenum-iron cluster-binding protein [unclassified Sulfurospirillum]